MTDFSPREIVSELDRFIVGQADAKRAVAIALRNRWRRLQLDDRLREEVLPKNILMIGPTGVGKTEISRRLAKLAGAPFLKVEATKFTEVGYVGRDVEQIVRDLVEVAITLTRDKKRKDVKTRAEKAAEDRVLDALVGANSSSSTKEAFRKKLRTGELDDKEIEIEVQAAGGGMPMIDIPGMPGAQMGAISIGDIFGKLGGGRTKTRRVTVHEFLRDSDQRGIRQAARHRSADAGSDQDRREQRHRLPRRDRQDLRARRPRRRRRVARRRAARSVAADRRHDGRHQARLGEDRPYPVHRVGRLPHFQAVGSVARTARPAADPRRIEAAHPRRLPPHPHRAGSFLDQAIYCADGDGRRDARIFRRRDRCRGRRRGGGEFERGEYRRAAVADGDGARARRYVVRRAGPFRRNRQRSMPTTWKSMSAIWPRTPISAALFSRSIRWPGRAGARAVRWPIPFRRALRD